MTLRRVVLGLLVLLLVPAGLLTCARLLDPRGGLWVRLVAFTPYAVPLYGVALLVLCLAWWRATGRRRTSAKVTAGLVVLPLALHVVWASGPYVGPTAAVADGRGTFRVMTANLEVGRADPSQVVETAVDNRVDVLVVQEVTREALARMRAAGLFVAFPHRAGKPADGYAGTMVFSRRGIGGVRRLDTGFGGYSMRVGVPGRAVTLLAVHARPPLGDARGWAADLNAVRSAAVGEDGPMMIVGDFNATLDHLPMRDLAGRGFDDAAVEATSGWQPTWPSQGEVSLLGLPVPSLLQIDHVLVNRALHATSTKSVSLAGTDHRAVVAILTR